MDINIIDINKKKSAANITVLVVFIYLELLNILVYLGIISGADDTIDLIYTLISQIVCMGIIPFFLFSRLYGGKSGADGPNMTNMTMEVASIKPMRQGSASKIFLIAFLLLFVNLFIANIAMRGIEAVGYNPPLGGGRIYSGYGDLFLWVLITAVLPATFEEFTFRGIMLGSYKDSPLTGIILSAFMFAIMHMNVMQVFYAFVGGLILGFAVYKTGSLLAGFIIHFSINAFSALMGFGSQYPDSLPGFFYNVLTSPLASILMFFGAIPMLAVIIIQIRSIDYGDKAKIPLLTKTGRQPLTQKAALYGAVTLGTLMTVFTFIWGLVR